MKKYTLEELNVPAQALHYLPSVAYGLRVTLEDLVEILAKRNQLNASLKDALNAALTTVYHLHTSGHLPGVPRMSSEIYKLVAWPYQAHCLPGDYDTWHSLVNIWAPWVDRDPSNYDSHPWLVVYGGQLDVMREPSDNHRQEVTVPFLLKFLSDVSCEQ